MQDTPGGDPHLKEGLCHEGNHHHRRVDVCPRCQGERHLHPKGGLTHYQINAQ